MYYKDEKTNVLVDIILLGITVLVAIGMYGSYKQFTRGDFDLYIFLIAESMLIIWIIIPLYLSLSNIKNSKYNKEVAQKIKNNGIMFKGTIIDMVYIQRYNYRNSIFKNATRIGDTSCTSVKVKYNYNGYDYTVVTPGVMFRKGDLLSKDVDVYVYNEMVYVDNFKVGFK